MGVFTRQAEDASIVKRDNGRYYIRIMDSYSKEFIRSFGTRSLDEAKLLKQKHFIHSPELLNLSLDRISMNDFYSYNIREIASLEISSSYFNPEKSSSTLVSMEKYRPLLFDILRRNFNQMRLSEFIEGFLSSEFDSYLKCNENCSYLLFFYTFISRLCDLYVEVLDVIGLATKLKSLPFTYYTKDEILKLFDYTSQTPLQGVNLIFNILRLCIFESELNRDPKVLSNIDKVIGLIEKYAEYNDECLLPQIILLYRSKLSISHFHDHSSDHIELDKVIGLSDLEINLRHDLYGAERGSLFKHFLRHNAKIIIEAAFISKFSELKKLKF